MKCERCETEGARRTLCDECQKESHEYWNEMWNEYYNMIY
jgi:hypothetical protein